VEVMTQTPVLIPLPNIVSDLLHGLHESVRLSITGAVKMVAIKLLFSALDSRLVPWSCYYHGVSYGSFCSYWMILRSLTKVELVVSFLARP
jgi:hypothetical protein